MVSPKNPKQLTTEQEKKYTREIDECKNDIVQKLSSIVGKNQIARYLSYLDQHKALADPPKFAPSTGVGAVLRKTDIEHFCEERMPPLIDPLEPNCLRESASYELRLGSRYRVGDSDEAKWLTDSKKDLVIEPHSIAIVSTYEWLNIPGCLIARWNLRVRMVYRGLVWVGSLQVDPGYQGFLFCPIYNLSNRQQILIYKDPLFIIDFVLTTPHKGKYGLWALRGDRYSTFDFDRLDEQKIQSAPEHSFHQMRGDIAKLESKMERFQDTILVVVGVIVAALAIIATFGIANTKWESSWIQFAVTIFALILSAVAITIAALKSKSKS